MRDKTLAAILKSKQPIFRRIFGQFSANIQNKTVINFNLISTLYRRKIKIIMETVKAHDLTMRAITSELNVLSRSNGSAIITQGN